jgi:hypothetical protein
MRQHPIQKGAQKINNSIAQRAEDIEGTSSFTFTSRKIFVNIALQAKILSQNFRIRSKHLVEKEFVL